MEVCRRACGGEVRERACRKMYAVGVMVMVMQLNNHNPYCILEVRERACRKKHAGGVAAPRLVCSRGYGYAWSGGTQAGYMQ